MSSAEIKQRLEAAENELRYWRNQYTDEETKQQVLELEARVNAFRDEFEAAVRAKTRG